MEINKDIFKQKLLNGEIRPDSVNRTFDSKGPIIMLNFSRFRLRVNIPINDSGENENSVRSHIKTYEGEPIDFIYERELDRIRTHIEKYEKILKVKNMIDKNMSITGFNKVEIEHNHFSLAYVIKRSRLIGSFVFLIVDSYDENKGLEEYVKMAKKWCEDELDPSKVLNDTFLNLIILHEGQLNKNSINGLPDKTGFHRTIIRSVTIIDIFSNAIHQVSYKAGAFFNLSSNYADALKKLKILSIE